EGSTRLWETHPEAMKAALARHDLLLHQAVAAHTGVVFKTFGDQFCAVFASAPDAIEAAVEIQPGLQAERWGESRSPPVPVALHSGAAEAGGGDYFGPTLNGVARLLGAGHGGQILLSRVIGELAGEQLPQGTSLRNLGQHRLKDLVRSEQIFQLVVPDLPAEF